MIPCYLKQIYIWALKLNKPLSEKALSGGHMYIYDNKQGDVMIMDMYGMNNFLAGYYIEPKRDNNLV